MFYPKDTICAISTPIGNGAIAVIRISGPQSIEIVSSFFKGKKNLSSVKSHSIVFGKIIDKNSTVDEVLISVFKAPHSYTGEDLVEISCHGSNFIANRILELLLSKARLAEPGEFTKRAFLNDKMDLTQAEAVGDLLMAKTKFAHLAAIKQLEGSLHKKIKNLLDELTSLRTLVELEIDFLEQDLPELDINSFKRDLTMHKTKLQRLLIDSENGMILKEGLKVSLVGAPNVGKSSIFNKLLKTERAIVTPIPGTTRDYLEEAISLEGYLIRIFDTAGIRSTNDTIEQIGIKRSYDVIKNSDLVLFITDSYDFNHKEYEKLKSITDENKIIKILNKSDLLKDDKLPNTNDFILCNTIQPNGLDKLKKTILDKININPEIIQNGILTNMRQISAVKNALTSIDKALEAIKNDMGYEFIAFDLKEASSYMEEILGKVTSEDILNNIFSNFCIGK